MSITSPDFQQLADWASQLSPGEQLELVVCISENLKSLLSGEDARKLSVGSAARILHAIREPPHLSVDDVDELERNHRG